MQKKCNYTLKIPIKALKKYYYWPFAMQLKRIEIHKHHERTKSNKVPFFLHLSTLHYMLHEPHIEQLVTIARNSLKYTPVARQQKDDQGVSLS